MIGADSSLHFREDCEKKKARGSGIHDSEVSK